jgi:organic radical activating enzyme
MAESLLSVDFAPGQARGMFVTWTLHNACNYHCSYCPGGLNDGTLREVDGRDVIAFADRVLEVSRAAGIERWTFAFSGGEPTFFPDFATVLRELYARGIDTTFTSNGGRPLSWWREACDYFDHCVFSYHPEFADHREFVDKARYLTGRVMLNVDFMMTPQGFDQCLAAARDLDGLPNIRVEYLPVQREFGNHGGGLVDYSPAQLEFLRQGHRYVGEIKGEAAQRLARRGFFGRGHKLAHWRRDGAMVSERLDYKQIVAHDHNHFSGWSCAAGLESLVVDIHGRVYRAYCMEGGPLGTVRGELVLPRAPVRCSQARCTCSVDIEISKARPTA